MQTCLVRYTKPTTRHKQNSQSVCILSRVKDIHLEVVACDRRRDNIRFDSDVLHDFASYFLCIDGICVDYISHPKLWAR